MVFHVNVYEPLGCEKVFPPPPPPAAAPSTSSPLFFLKSISETHSLPSKCYVTIPSGFVKAHGLGDRKKMILKVPFVRGKWPVELGTWQGGKRGAAISLRTAIRTRGWYKFYEDNGLKIGDCCKFVLKEVPDSKSKPVIMEVDIKRMVLGSSKAVVNFE
ncbi:B3 domain-containing protein REM16-like [Pyrus communis]|uniref:B3 domain-containing protein REM16-like n=1 Tax=Pyrus communis TaxID=23211 RepID=UPI0035C152C1